MKLVLLAGAFLVALATAQQASGPQRSVGPKKSTQSAGRSRPTALSVPQSRRERPPIEMGMTRAEVRNLIGTPQIYRKYSDPGRNDIPSGAIGKYPPSKNYADVYTYSTKENTYEMELQYGLDSSQSRLHPSERVTLVRWIPDKPVAKPDFLKAAQDVPEIIALCRLGCVIERSQSSALDITFLRPTTVSAQEQAMADQIGSYFGAVVWSGFKPHAVVYFDQGSVSTLLRGYDPPSSLPTAMVNQGIWTPTGLSVAP